MRSYEVFANMTPEQAVTLLEGLAEKAPGMVQQAVAAAALAMKARPVYLQRQPFEKRAHAVRRALARVSSEAVAGELLAVYFLQCRKDLLVEWLDALGLQHEDGVLEADAPPAPPDKQLAKTVDAFLAVDSDPDRKLLLAAFAAQEAIDWPVLDGRIAPSG